MSKQMREMKDSGIEWIGEIPKEWTIKKFKYTFKIIGGSGFKEEYQGNENGDFPFCKASDINGSNMFLSSARNYVDQELVKKERYSIVPVNSIIVAKIGEALKKNHRKINTVPCIVDNNCEAFSTVSNDLAKYNYYILLIVDLSRFDNGGTVPSVNNDKLKNFYFPCPSIPTQHRIVDYLDDKCGKIDRYIEQQKQVIEKLKAYKQSVITEAVTKGLDPTVPMKDSGVEWIGEIPEGWEVRKLKSLTTMISKGTTPTTVGKDLVDFGNIRFIKCENIIGGEIENEPEFFIDEETNEKLKRSKLEINDILFVIAGATIGKTAIVKESNLPANTNQAVSFVRLKNKSDARFVWYYLQSNMVKAVLKLLSVQSAQPNLSMTDLGNFYLPYTEYKSQNEIDNYLDKKCSAIDSAIEKKQTLIEELTEYKKSLIYEVVTGKKEV